MTDRRPKAPYPWRGLWRVIWVSCSSLLLIGTAYYFATLHPHHEDLGDDICVVLIVIGTAVGSAIALQLAKRSVIEHKNDVRVLRQDWQRQSSGTAPLLRPADAADESLLRATTMNDETPKEILVRPAQDLQGRSIRGDNP